MKLFIAGAGGFGRETLDAILAGALEVEEVVFLDDALAGSAVRGVPVIAPDEASSGRFVVAIADSAARRSMVARLSAEGLEAATIQHPRAAIAPDTSVGRGCVLLANAYVSSSVVLGDHVHINYNATVGHDARLDDVVTVYPGANIGGGVHIEAGASVGSNACVLQGLTVGRGAFVGAGAVLTRNAPAAAVLVGVPARQLSP